MRAVLVVSLLALLAPAAAAHGDLEINELETLAIRDFEGFEDSFPWGGFEIWDVYVGEGYNETLGSDGVYLKINLAGDGTKRAPGQQAWTVTSRFTVGDETIERSFSHDGTTITTDFESFLWMVADGNVLQVKGWTPIRSASGASVTEITILSAVDGDARDAAPGGVFAPQAGAELPITAPASPMFPPMGEGRVVDEVPLNGTARYVQVEVVPLGGGRFTIKATNPLAEQGQHIFLRPTVLDGWAVELPKATSLNLKAGESGEFTLTLSPTAAAGAALAPLVVNILTDIGGRLPLAATLVDGEVRLVPLADAAAGVVPGGVLPSPAGGLAAVLFAAALVAAARRGR